MSVAIVTGSAGLIGSVTARHLAAQGRLVVGVDNLMRELFFGPDGAVRANLERLERDLGSGYVHTQADVRDQALLGRVMRRYGRDVSIVVHAAGQPSHNWAKTEPQTDFEVNAVGTLNVLELCRRYCPEAAVIHCSSSMVYGNHVNGLPFVELNTRWDLPANHPDYDGTSESAPIDGTTHTLFGASKLAADVMAQEYGRSFDLRVTVLRTGQVCGPALAATRQHGMPAFVMRSAMESRPYVITGFAGKQVRDVLHPADLMSAFDAVIANPSRGAVYNLGGGRENSCSVLEVIELAQQITGTEMSVSVAEQGRDADRRWWITNNAKFRAHHPDWRPTWTLPAILTEIRDANADRWNPAHSSQR